MDDPSVNPLYLAVLFLLRCLVPLLIMLGLSELLRRWGLLKRSAPPPQEPPENENNHPQGGLAHGKV
ncbi:MAG: hypothetical protein PHS96_09670 [Anaerolineales bacterium]|jgi:hypothetical protein|nr:hypothetical protein [Anaerolineales bacterium]MDD5468064.1 hypothetical protein [Anaerolineales bacterium]